MKEIDTTALKEAKEEKVFAYLAEAEAPDWKALESNPQFGHHWVVYFLERKQFISPEQIRLLYRTKSLTQSYAVNRALVRCKFTPVGIAANLISLLRWLDLLNVLRQPYISGGLKSKIEKQIMDRFPRMAVGEKTVLAKQAPRGLIRQLRLQPDPRVIKALFTNYFFTLDDAAFLANYPRISQEILVELANCAKWTQHKRMRMDLLSNPKLPAGAITPLLRGLTSYDVRQILQKPGISPAVKQRLKRMNM